MAKDKRNITDFRKALLSNSKYIGMEAEDHDQPKKTAVKKGRDKEFSIALQPALFIELEKLAAEYQLDTNEFANLALAHFLKIDYVRKSK
jgi:hypothetical protein